MNKTFKVIFSRVRSSYVVANEITRSAKKKGAKALLIAAALTISSASYAFGLNLFFSSSDVKSNSEATQPTQESTKSEPVYTSRYSWDSSADSTAFSFADAWSPTDAGVAEFRGIEMKEGAAGSLSNLSVTVDANQPTDKNVFSSAVYGIYNDASSGSKESGPSFSGDTLTVEVESEFKGGVAAIKTSNNMYISAAATTLTATASNASQDSVSGLYVTGDGKTVEISGAATITSTLSSKHQGLAVRAFGIYQSGTNAVTVGAAEKDVSITATATNADEWDDAVSLHQGATNTLIGKKIELHSTGRGLFVTEGSTANVGNAATESILIDSNFTGIRAAAKNTASASTVNLTAKDIQIDTEENGIEVSTSENVSVTADASNSIRIDTKNIGISAGVQGTESNEISANENPTVGINLTAGKSLAITTENGRGVAVAKAGYAVNLSAKEISIDASKYSAIGVSAGSSELNATDGSITLTSRATDTTPTVSVENSGSLTLSAKTLVINHFAEPVVTEEKETVEPTEPTPGSHISAAQISVASAEGAEDEKQAAEEQKPTGVAVSVGSCAQLTIISATSIEAPTVFNVSGGSTTKVNESGSATTKLTGDIVFNSDATLGITLNGKDSSWTGRAYQSYETDGQATESVSVKPISEVASAVKGFALKVADGAKWILTEGASFVNKLTLSNGGVVDATNATVFNAGTYNYNATTAKVEAGIKVEGKGNKLTLGNATETDVTIVMAADSELITPLATAFKTTTKEDSSLVVGASARLTISGDKSAELTIDDAFTYTNAALTAMTEAYSDITLNLTKATLVASDTEKATLVDGVIQGNTTVEVDVAKDAETVSLGSTSSSVKTGAQTITINSESPVDVTVNNLTLVGKTDGSDFIENAKTVSVAEGATLNLGSTETETATSGSLPAVTLSSGAALNVTNAAVTTPSLTGGEGVTINLGTTEAAGALHTEELALNGATVFLDPAWQNGSTISDASSFSATSVSNLKGRIVAGQNAIVTLGAAKDAAVSGFNKVAEKNGLTWAENGVTAGLYIAKPLTLTSSTVLVDGSLTSAPAASSATGLEVASHGILMLDQDGIGSSPAVTGATVTIANDATVAVINAKGGTTLQLTDGAVSISGLPEDDTPATKTVLTDNPFVTGTLTTDTGSIALTETADETGIDVIASMGVQTMIRNADAVLAETIADRVAAAETGNGLWVTVRGERFKQTSLGNGAGFSANVGYGAFGAEFNPTENTNLGVAFQYGHGTVKGKVYGVKNKTKDYGVALYGSVGLGETGIKLLGEVAYTQSKNDITNNYYTGLNQDLDAKMISGGVTVQKTFEAGSVNVTPSVGVRISRINTDAMRAGAATIEKQKQTLVQVPVAVRVAAKAIETTSGWTITPHAKVAYVPTFGDKEINIFGVEKTVIDTSPVQGAFGVGFKKGNCSIDATAHVGAGKKGSSVVGAKFGFTYRF